MNLKQIYDRLLSMAESYFTEHGIAIIAITVIMLTLICILLSVRQRRRKKKLLQWAEYNRAIQAARIAEALPKRRPYSWLGLPSKALYRKKPLLTPCEIQFYKDFLLPYVTKMGYSIFAQIAFSALYDKDYIYMKKYTYIFNTYYMDFVVYDKNFEPIFAIEFDSFQHRSKPETIERDVKKNFFFASIAENSKDRPFGFFRIPYDDKKDIDLRVDSFRRPYIEMLSFLLDAPYCDDCHEKMAIRYNSDTNQLFWGCGNKNDEGKWHKGKSLL